MRRLPLPTTDDLAALDKLARSRAASAKAIRNAHPDIRAQYAVYEATGGDPWQVTAGLAFAAFSDDLQKLYSEPPVALDHINTIRHGLTGACPMCGRDALGTLDHYLPQADYPEFCFFSRNLVPACSRCNTARSNAVKGAVQGQRALQPYFDTFASQRVMTVQLTPDWRAPDIQPVAFNVQGIALQVVAWQIENVVKPSGFVEYAEPIWATFVNEPLEIFDPIPTTDAIRETLEKFERAETAMSKSQNAWKACIYHGVRHNADAVEFLALQVQQAMHRS